MITTRQIPNVNVHAHGVMTNVAVCGRDIASCDAGKACDKPEGCRDSGSPASERESRPQGYLTPGAGRLAATQRGCGGQALPRPAAAIHRLAPAFRQTALLFVSL